jgi:anti-sigma factor RsiW
MNWNCAQTEEQLSDYIDGQLSAIEKAAFQSHLATCPSCAQLATQVSALVHRMQALEPLEAPDHLSARILDATLGPRKQQSAWERLLAWLPNLAQPRFAMGAATVAASFVIVLHTAGITPNHLKKQDLTPANILRAANREAHLTYAKGVKFVNDLRVVYEIQSRLQPEPQPSAAPAREPAPQQQNPSPSTSPQEKSQTQPGHTQIHTHEMLACLLAQTFPTETSQ